MLHPTGLTRRTFLRRLAISSAALAGMNRGLGEGQVERKVRFGLIADVHQDVMPDGLERVRAFVKAMTAAKPEIPDPAVLPPDEIPPRCLCVRPGLGGKQRLRDGCWTPRRPESEAEKSATDEPASSIRPAPHRELAVGQLRSRRAPRIILVCFCAVARLATRVCSPAHATTPR